MKPEKEKAYYLGAMLTTAGFILVMFGPTGLGWALLQMGCTLVFVGVIL